MSLGVLKIRLFGDPCLREKSKPVKEVGPVERMLITAMFETVKAHKGIGLAAPQVGINEQIFVIDTGEEVLAVVNPKILKTTGHDDTEEGCLSIPDFYVNVKRAKVIEVEFTDENNHCVHAKLSGLPARVFQHETDHLLGKLIVDYLPPAEQKKILKSIKDGSYAGKAKDHAVGAGKI